MSEEIDEEVRKTLLNIKKEYGDGVSIQLSHAPKFDVPCIPTGILSLDIILGTGGFPSGRAIQLLGPESSGKSSICLHYIAECHKQGKYTAYIDAEHALDLEYAEKLGINPDLFLLTQPDNAEQGLSVAEEWIRSGAVACVVIDSVAALVPTVELEGDISDQQMGLQARLIGKACRMFAGVLSKTGTTLIWVNQLRSALGVTYGSTETSPGGRALKYFCTQILDVRRVAAIKDVDDTVGARTKLKIVKNKLAIPFRTCELDLIYGIGFDRYMDIIELSVAKNLIEKGGAWFTYNEQRFQGRANLKQALVESPELFAKLEAQVREAYGV